MLRYPLFIPLFLLSIMVGPNAFAGVDTIVISPGHGGYDFGIRSGNIKEKDIALTVSKQVEDIFREYGMKVQLIRKIDKYVSIEERITTINKARPGLLVAVHLSANDQFAVYVASYDESGSDIGLKQFYSLSSKQRKYLYESKTLSSVMEETIKEVFGKKVNHREMPISVLRSVGAPAILVELPSQGLDYEKDQAKVAGAIALGILRYGQK